MISTNDLRPGMALDLPGGLFQVLEHQHVKPGKGKAFVRTTLRNLNSGAVVDRTFRAGENLPRAIIDRADYQYLYSDDLGYVCMNLETYDQMTIPTELVGDAADFLVESMVVQVNTYQGRPIGIELPASVELEVTYTEPGVKGDRVSGATKPATLSTGLVIQAPLFVNQGDVLKVDTRSGAYITRVT